MLDDPKSQAIYRALRSSEGLSSPAAGKAATAMQQATSLTGRFTSLSDLPDDGPPIAGGPAIKIPPQIRAAAGKFATYQEATSSSGGVLGALGGAIDQRMEDVTSKFAVFGVAADVAQKMGDAESGCGPLGSAFSVLTSTSGTDMLKAAMDMASGPLGELETLVAKYASSITGSMSSEDQAKLQALLHSMDGIAAQIKSARDQVKGMVDEAQAMWGHLQTTFNQAIQASILGSIINNPCLRDIADSVMPDSVKSVVDSFD
ncbi:DUF7217 family protein [Aeromonas hydrophila]|uniref:DUF7217 family protein n=1 Tax=Aeromonas hydrophila TaxID=644 RepID=UPI00080AA434|nr:hypothetical protein [Aeromonas hydrophila]ANT70238.1 hypothetical protein TK34_22495 [Aeromonas hydrophila]